MVNATHPTFRSETELLTPPPSLSVEDLFGCQGVDGHLVVLGVHPWKVYIFERCHEMRSFGEDKTAAVDEVDDAPFLPAPCREALSRLLAASLLQMLE